MRTRGKWSPFIRIFWLSLARRRALGLSLLPSCLQHQVPHPGPAPSGHQRFPMTTADYAARGQPGRGRLRSHLRVRAGENRAVPRLKPGCGWKHQGCGRKQSGTSTRWGRRPGSGEELGRRSGSPSSPASPSSRARLPPPSVRTWAGPENATPPSPKNDLGGKLPALRSRGAATAKEAEAERSRAGFPGADAAPGSLIRGVTAAMTGVSGPRLRLSAAAHPGPQPAAARAVLPPPACPRRPRAGGLQRRRSCELPGALPPAPGSRPPARAEAPCPSEAPPRPAARAPEGAEEPSLGSRSRSRRSGPRLAPHLRPRGGRPGPRPCLRAVRGRGQPREPPGRGRLEAENTETPEPGGFPKYRRAAGRPVSLRHSNRRWWSSPPRIVPTYRAFWVHTFLKAHPCPLIC